MLFPTGLWPLLALGLVALTWLCRWITTGRLTVYTEVDIPIVIIVSMALVGYMISVEQGLSYTRLWSLILGVVVFYGIVNSLRSDRQTWVVSSFLAVLMIGIAGISLLGTDWQQTRLINVPWIYDHLPALIRGLPNSGVPRASDLIQPRFVGITMGVFVAVFLPLLFFSHNRNLHLLSMVVVIIGFGLIFLTQTLTGLAGVLVAVLFLAIWRSRWFLVAFLLSLACGLVALLTVDTTRLIQYLLAVDNPAGIAVALRLDMWSRALAMIRDMPFTGIGLNTFPVIQTSFYPGFLLGPEPHAHNLLLQTALDLGVPGLVAFLWLLIAWLFMVWRKYQASENHEYRVLLLGLIGGVLAYFVAGFIDAMMLGAKPGVVFWILLGIGAAPMRTLESVESAVPVKNSHLLRSLALIAIIITIPLACAMIKPAAIYMNIGAIQAHLALYPSLKSGSPELSALQDAKANLLKGLSLDPRILNAYELLGRIYAWEGMPDMAMNAFAQRVSLDREDPLLHYFPSVPLLRLIQGVDSDDKQNWDDLLQIYSHWRDRFPDRAEVYAEMGLVWQCYLDNTSQSESLLRSGMEKQARPNGLLEYYHNLLSYGDASLCFQKK
jgi:putative inorganic carbon (HCO3(-)) transporter